MTTATDMFAKENFVETRRPTLEASTLPGACYTAEAWYQAEVERIFLREWLLVGRAEQIPNPGDYMTEAIVGETVLLVRGRDALIRAFSPSCRHRGTKIVSGHGNCRAFVCPYHRWTYALDGELVGTPDMDPPRNFDKSRYGLLPIRLEIWEGFLFVNFDEHARPLRDHLGDLPALLLRYRPGDLVLTRQKTYLVDCNWKVYVDNSIEVYHVASVHQKSIQEVGPMDTWTIDKANGAYLMLYGTFPGSLALLKGVEGFPPIEGLGQGATERHDLPWVLPNTHFLCTADTFWWLTMFPEGPERTRIVVNSSFPKSTVARNDFQEVVERYYERLRVTNVEDNVIAEAQQQGLGMRTYRPGRYSAHEILVHDFANYIIDRVIGNGEHAAR